MGVGLAAVIAAIFRTVSADWSARRIQAANWRDLAALAASPRTQARHGYAARMLDRIGLLQPRLALAKRPDDVMAADALRTCAWAATSPNCSARAATCPWPNRCYARARRTGALLPRSLVLARRPENAGILAQIDRAGRRGGRACRRRARPRGGGAGGHPPRLLPRRPSTNPPIPTWRATHHDRRIQSLRHLLPWLLVLGVVTLGVAWALRRLLARRPVPRWYGTRRCSTWRCSLLYGVTPDIPHIFQRLA